MNHSVPQNENGDAAFVRALQLAEEILPNGPVGVKMGKLAINKGMDVSSYLMIILFSFRRHRSSFRSKVWKNEKNSFTEKIFREINPLVASSSVKMLLSQIFFQKV